MISDLVHSDDTVYAQNMFVRFAGVSDSSKVKIGIRESDKMIDFVTVKAYIFPYQPGLARTDHHGYRAGDEHAPAGPFFNPSGSHHFDLFHSRVVLYVPAGELTGKPYLPVDEFRQGKTSNLCLSILTICAINHKCIWLKQRYILAVGSLLVNI